MTEIRMSQSQIVKIAKLRLKIYFLRTYFRDFDSLFSNRHPQADKSSTAPPVKRPSLRNEKRRKPIRPNPNHFRYSFYRIESSDRRRFEVTEIRMSQSQIVKIAKLRLKIYFLRSYFRDFDSFVFKPTSSSRQVIHTATG